MLAFTRRVSKEIIGCPQPFNACADPVVCNGMGVYLQVQGGRVAAAHWWCGECSDAERETLEIACQLATGKTIDALHRLSAEEFEAAGGGNIPDVRMTSVRVLLAVEMALVDHRVKSTLAASVGQSIEPARKLKQLGFVARQGQQQLKTLLEGELAPYKLRIPAVKTQEWTAFGTLEDCSRWVQSALKTDLLNEVMERCFPSPYSIAGEEKTAHPD
ncbi:MAG TPA: hypothetical protein VNP04_02265 [Alphaproteobacteria bacterium]|nr:hypothetical protein [Alphaproteobacteria bacterium]